jgi:hypothetical protein
MDMADAHIDEGMGGVVHYPADYLRVPIYYNIDYNMLDYRALYPSLMRGIGSFNLSPIFDDRHLKKLT